MLLIKYIFVCNPKGKYLNLKAINVDEHTHYIIKVHCQIIQYFVM